MSQKLESYQFAFQKREGNDLLGYIIIRRDMLSAIREREKALRQGHYCGEVTRVELKMAEESKPIPEEILCEKIIENNLEESIKTI